MSEEEKKAIETVENFIKYYKDNEQTGNRANLDVLGEEVMAIEFILNKYDVQENEINNLKEIEKSHQEENGKLRVEFEKVYEDNLTLAQELEQEKEKNKELKKYEEAYKLLSYALNNYISKDKIKEKIEELEKELKEFQELDFISEAAKRYQQIQVLNNILEV